MNEFKQYKRRGTLEIAGIGTDIEDVNVEEECLKILKAAKVKIGNKFASTHDIQAAHRIGRKGTVILKFVNRKFAYEALLNSKKLKDHEEYGQVYINQSLCPEFGYLAFAVRKAKRSNEIASYTQKHGITFIQKFKDGPLIKISHELDLSRNGISVPSRDKSS